jgi:hypothetical protein
MAIPTAMIAIASPELAPVKIITTPASMRAIAMTSEIRLAVVVGLPSVAHPDNGRDCQERVRYRRIAAASTWPRGPADAQSQSKGRSAPTGRPNFPMLDGHAQGSFQCNANRFGDAVPASGAAFGL